ncbi:type II toxin-antitoxin system RelE family toxin [Wolbachia endosymbiont (group A) of Agelastica alni]|uniref:type II toxin-antitoxin system RelE family toxin n=1 Tax=Wolbachia endosymbiont (group A) of Agelastica alni TaxID=3066130 RepID=UPI00333F374A
MKYNIIYSEKVLERDFLTLPPTIRSRIRRAIDERLTINLGEPLSGRLVGSKRLRVGDYRIIYKVDKLENTDRNRTQKYHLLRGKCTVTTC